MTRQVLTVLVSLMIIFSASVALAVDADKVLVHEDIAKRLVDEGLAHVAKVGAEQAAKDFMDPDSGFIKGSFYLLFYTYDGTCLALGAKPEIAGKNRWNVHDPDGVYQVQKMIENAKAGGGWVKYKYVNPVTKNVQKKKTWSKPVPGMDAFMACGIYY